MQPYYDEFCPATCIMHTLVIMTCLCEGVEEPVSAITPEFCECVSLAAVVLPAVRLTLSLFHNPGKDLNLH
jgi:hypothetical protein